MNHVDKHSWPDLLKGTNVKVEPAGGTARREEKLKLACTAHSGTHKGTSEVC